MARIVTISGKEYEVYSIDFSLSEAIQAERDGKRNVLVSHSCPECGAELLGTVQAAKEHGSRPKCAIHSRPGIFEE